MSSPEHSGEHPLPNKTEQQQDRGIAIQATPLPDQGVVFQKTPHGGLTISFTGEIAIALPPAVSETAAAVLSSTNGVGYSLIPEGAPPPLSEPHSGSDTDADTLSGSESVESDAPAQHVPDDKEIITKHITFAKAPQSDLRPSEPPTNGLLPDSTERTLSGAHSEPDGASRTASETQKSDLHIPESENEKHEFIGNPVRDPAYWVRKSGTRIADFHLATHDEKGNTTYYRIRAFDERADRVRDTVRRGQKDVEVVAYGPKYWKVRRKTQDGQWKEELTEGYYAGFVCVPKKYRQETPQPATREPLGN